MEAHRTDKLVGKEPACYQMTAGLNPNQWLAVVC